MYDEKRLLAAKYNVPTVRSTVATMTISNAKHAARLNLFPQYTS